MNRSESAPRRRAANGAQDRSRSLDAEIRRLSRMSLAELRANWSARLGRPPPRLRSVELLALALAHQLQVEALGDVRPSIRRRLDELAKRYNADPNFVPVAGMALKPGCSLVRDWHGERHEVWVLDAGFSYRGEHIGSLSEVAQKITGTKWNGRLFFGLTGRSRTLEVGS